MKSKIAFLILAHHDPEMLRTLIHSLDFAGFDIYVHVDAKKDISIFQFDTYHLKFAGLYVLDKREKVYWGDYSVFKATYNMYYVAHQKNIYFRYVTLSGNDYPLKSNEYIYNQLSNLNIEYIMGTPVERIGKISNYNFMRGYFWIRKFKQTLFDFLHIRRLKTPLIIEGKEITFYYGPQWHALSDECVSYLIDYFERNYKVLKRTFYYSYAPDELVIPTIVFNSKFSQNSLRSSFPRGTHYNKMTSIHYINYEPIVQVFEETDAEMLLNSGKLFTRKLTSEKSKRLIEIIDEYRTNSTLDSTLT